MNIPENSQNSRALKIPRKFPWKVSIFPGTFPPFTTLDRLLTHFGNRLSSATPSKKLGLIIYYSKITEKEAIQMVKHDMHDAENVDYLLSEAAHVLGTMLLEVKKQFKW